MSYLKRLSYVTAAKGLALSSLITMCDQVEPARQSRHVNIHPEHQRHHIKPQYSHIILGFGTAGSAATHELLKNAKSEDSVLIVDPVVSIKKSVFPLHQDKRLTFEENYASNIDHVHKIVELADGTRVKYQNCLISVGSTAAPFNPQYIDSGCDLPQTVVDLTHPNAPHDLYSVLINETNPDGDANASTNQAKTVALVGANCFESVELAGRLAMAAEYKHHDLVLQIQQEQKAQKLEAQQRARAVPQQSTLPSSANTTRYDKTQNRSNGHSAAGPAAVTLAPPLPVPVRDTVALIYPAYGPMAHTLPRYLSLALAKRLQGLGVQLVPYSYVRYLGATTSTANITTSTSTTTDDSVHPTQPQQAVLFLAKTYDSLNTQSIVADKVAFAPTSIPTQADRELQIASKKNEIKPDVNNHHVHGFLLRSGLELDRISGGVVANQSLQVCEGVYAAGDVSSVYTGYSSGCIDLREPNTIVSNGTASSSVGGAWSQQRGVVRGYENALYSGMVAGRNMAHATNSTTNTTNGTDCMPLLYNQTPIYEAHSPDIGVHFTFIGNCSSALESHGYWWKLGKVGSGTGNSGVGNNSNNNTSASDNAHAHIPPPLGLGVVFYIVDNSIAGVLISGLPTAPRTSGSGSGSGSVSYTDRVNTLCKALIGRQISTLDTHHNVTQNGARGSQRIDLSQAYEVPEYDVSSQDEEATLHQDGVNTTSVTTNTTNTANTTSTTVATTATETEVYTSQALSWEARKLISPVLSAALYTTHSMTDTTHHSQTTHPENRANKNNTFSTQLSKQLSAYPRPLYRYSGPSHTTLKDLTEPHLHSIIRPTVAREALFQPEFANTGSRADNVNTAYKRSLRKDLY